MRIDADRLLDSTVTVVNRVPAEEVGAEEDAYYATVLAPANWTKQTSKTTDADGTVHLTQTSRVQIPLTTGNYLQPKDYVSKAARAILPGDYTLSLGDVVIHGDAGLKSPLTRSELLKALEGTEYFGVKAVRDLTSQGGAQAPSAGCLKYVNCYQAEGE